MNYLKRLHAQRYISIGLETPVEERFSRIKESVKSVFLFVVALGCVVMCIEGFDIHIWEILSSYFPW